MGYNRKYRRDLKKSFHLTDMKAADDIANKIWSQQREKKIQQLSTMLQDMPANNEKLPLGDAEISEAEISSINLDENCPYSEEEVLQQIKGSNLASLIKEGIKN